ncbi:MAG: Gfo/Idh/MocA family oxidoreductase [Clostridia bacterium]|nr:Gfo/Idh/MocA family oxidoreductase [Clostridia bacterium]
MIQPADTVLSYVIVGSGYRSQYFARVAKTYPDRFLAIFLCRTQSKADLIAAQTGIPATVSVEDCLRFGPDFAVIAVDRGHVADVAEEWVLRGYPVVTETPVGASSEQLERIRAWGERGARIVCCEQYPRQPILAAGLRQLALGTIGKPTSVYISLLHDYHAAGLIRQALRIPPEEPYTIRALTQPEPVAETDSRGGAILDGRRTQAERCTALISFASGKQAVYDFSPIQYRSYVRSRHLTVRGDRGEWSDTQILYLDRDNRPQRIALTAEIPEKYRCLDTQALRDRRRNWSAELAPDTVQDEFAIASLLLDMGEYLRGGPSPYPLDEAIADAEFWLRLSGME